MKFFFDDLYYNHCYYKAQSNVLFHHCHLFSINLSTICNGYLNICLKCYTKYQNISITYSILIQLTLVITSLLTT